MEPSPAAWYFPGVCWAHPLSPVGVPILPGRHLSLSPQRALHGASVRVLQPLSLAPAGMSRAGMCHLDTSAALRGELLEMLVLSGSRSHFPGQEAFSSLRLQSLSSPPPLSFSLQQCRGEENQQRNISDNPGPSSRGPAPGSQPQSQRGAGLGSVGASPRSLRAGRPHLVISTAGFLPKLLRILSGDFEGLCPTVNESHVGVGQINQSCLCYLTQLHLHVQEREVLYQCGR